MTIRKKKKVIEMAQFSAPIAEKHLCFSASGVPTISLHFIRPDGEGVQYYYVSLPISALAPWLDSRDPIGVSGEVAWRRGQWTGLRNAQLSPPQGGGGLSYVQCAPGIMSTLGAQPPVLTARGAGGTVGM